MGAVLKSKQESLTVLAVDNKIISLRLPPNRLEGLPYDPTPENIPKFKLYLADQFASRTFKLSTPFPEMSTPPAHMHLKSDAVPYARHTPILISHHWKAKN